MEEFFRGRAMKSNFNPGGAKVASHASKVRLSFGAWFDAVETHHRFGNVRLAKQTVDVPRNGAYYGSLSASHVKKSQRLAGSKWNRLDGVRNGLNDPGILVAKKWLAGKIPAEVKGVSLMGQDSRS